MEDVVTLQPLGRARTATVIAVGPASRLTDVTAILGPRDDEGALHIVRISTDGDGSSPGKAPPDVQTISGLKPEYVNNAIAAVRLSSLPTIVWWRGGAPQALDSVAPLVDRVVLDADDPWPLWERTPALFEQTAITDVRWARLTRWRAALAHFLDLPPVQEAASSISSLAVSAADAADAALMAGWLDAAFGWSGRIAPDFSRSGTTGFRSLRLSGPTLQVDLQLLPNSTCVATEGRVGGQVVAARVVSLGRQELSSFMAEELRIRSRDLAFERAVAAALQFRPA
jgi:glucose-6-phosphate dehydrogenase assembly protein OpcA